MPKAAEPDAETGKPAAVREGGHATTPQPVSEPPSNGLDPNALRRYRVALASTARRFKIYPGLARERGWVGTADIQVSVFADGRMPQVQIVKSSGHAVLDNQARDMLVQAAQHTPLPDSLRGREFSEVLPVRFDLTTE